jgi:hypothetical protein
MLPALFILAGLSVAFLTRSGYLHRGYFEDDFGFLAMGPLHLRDLPGIFSPTGIDWFYRPVFVVYARILSALFGGASIPRHAMSLILFGLNAGVIGWFTARFTKQAGAGWLALALFVTASGMEQAIWWFSSASTLLASLFSFFALLAWMHWRRRGTVVWGGISGLCMAVAMCSKEDVAALPIILAVLDWGQESPRPIRSRLARFTWLTVWACLWLTLDLEAYRHVSQHMAVTRLWRPEFTVRLALAGSFCFRTLVLSLIGTRSFVDMPAWVMALGAALMVGWRVRHDRALSAVAISAVLAALPIPIASGPHVSSDRFAFYPQAWAAVLGAVLITRALKSVSRVTFMTGIAVGCQCLWSHLSPPMPDPFLIWVAMGFGALLTLYLALRVSQARLPLLLSAAALLGALAKAVFPGEAALCWGVVAGVCGVLSYRASRPLDGGICGVALMLGAPWTLVPYLIGIVYAQKHRASLD